MDRRRLTPEPLWKREPVNQDLSPKLMSSLHKVCHRWIEPETTLVLLYLFSSFSTIVILRTWDKLLGDPSVIQNFPKAVGFNFMIQAVLVFYCTMYSPWLWYEFFVNYLLAYAILIILHRFGKLSWFSRLLKVKFLFNPWRQGSPSLALHNATS